MHQGERSQSVRPGDTLSPEERSGRRATGRLVRVGREGAARRAYLGVEHVAGDAAKHDKPVLTHGPRDTQPRHPLQGRLVGFVVVTRLFALLICEVF